MPDAKLPEPIDMPEILDEAACQRALAILVDVGTSIANELKAANDAVPLPARAAAFDRVAMAVRRTILLSRHIAESASVSAESRQIVARKQIIREVDDSIERHADPAKAGSLRVELLERLDSPDFSIDLAHRSPSELIPELCRDLGLANMPGMRKFRRRTPEDIAILCAQAAAPPGSGLPQWLAAAAPQASTNDRATDPARPGSSESERRQL